MTRVDERDTDFARMKGKSGVTFGDQCKVVEAVVKHELRMLV